MHARAMSDRDRLGSRPLAIASAQSFCSCSSVLRIEADLATWRPRPPSLRSRGLTLRLRPPRRRVRSRLWRGSRCADLLARSSVRRQRLLLLLGRLSPGTNPDRLHGVHFVEVVTHVGNGGRLDLQVEAGWESRPPLSHWPPPSRWLAPKLEAAAALRSGPLPHAFQSEFGCLEL